VDSNHRLGDYEPPALPLSYAAKGLCEAPQCWSSSSPLTESNRGPSPYHGDALPSELRGRCEICNEESYPSIPAAPHSYDTGFASFGIASPSQTGRSLRVGYEIAIRLLQP
jgi:hypothetical protein